MIILHPTAIFSTYGNAAKIFCLQPIAVDREIRAATLQYSGKTPVVFQRAFRVNGIVFCDAVEDAARVSWKLLGSFEAIATIKKRRSETSNAGARSSPCFGT
ncbi:DUF2277 family protein [Rubrobacter indicoceani]|uniref:DUF2277 family protein n=1 Tax=Rubrobacter indicoceani TaxID=2051957 RepID=UPI0013C4595D